MAMFPCLVAGDQTPPRYPLGPKGSRGSSVGAVAERLRSGLQIRVHRFESGPRLHNMPDPA
jgi:hypothetical protein